MNNFIDWLDSFLPITYNYIINDNEIIILNNREYVYLFYEQEIEYDFEGCCSLLKEVIKLTGEEC